MEKYKYFCNSCGKEFGSDLPERNKSGLLNDIFCPECGALDVYPATKEGCEEAYRDFCEYDNRINVE